MWPEPSQPGAGMRGAVRSWLIRGLILTGVGCLGALAWVASTWVSPERVRQKLIEHLAEEFDGVDVHVGSARMRILGGIAVTDLRLTRHGDPPDKPFLVVPSAVLYHDKEQLNRGRLIIRKVELENPELHLERAADGTWNITEVMKAGPADRPVPTLVTTGAVVTITDHTPNGLPPVRLTDARITLLNDPLPVLTVQLQAAAGEFGPVHVRARMNRITRHLSVGLEFPHLPLAVAAGPAARFAPEIAPHLAKFAASAAVSADLTYTPNAAPAWRHDIRVEVKDGRFEHPRLPWPAEQVAVKLRAVDGRVKVEELTAKLGPAQVRATLETRAGPANRPAVFASARGSPDPDPLAAIESQLQKLDLTATGVPLDDALFTRLDDIGAKVKRVLSPTGTVDLGYRFTREGAGWKRELEIRPQSVTAMYEHFRYPLSDLRGWVRRTTTHTGDEHTVVNLRGTAGGQITIKGDIHGDGPDRGINLRIDGNNLPLDSAMIAALPTKYAEIVRQFRPSGRGDVVVVINQPQGVNLTETEFRFTIRDGAMTYARFPYRLEKMKGRVLVRAFSTDPTRPVRPGEPLAPLPDRDELSLDGVTGVHAGATLWLRGSKRAMPGSGDRKLLLQIGGSGCPIDEELHKALAALKVENLWTTLAPRGTITFAADIEVLDRAPSPGGIDLPFDPATDLRLTFNFLGPTVVPSFFRYELTDLSGWLEYRGGRLDLAHLSGQHGSTRVKLTAGEIRFYPGGVVWANLGGLEVKPFVADPAMIRALPGKLGPGLDGVKLRGPAELHVKHLVVLTPPDSPSSGPVPPPAMPELAAAASPVPTRPPLPIPVPPGEEPDPVVYWDAELRLAGASLDTGVEWSDVFGAVACRGRYEGTHMGLLRGNVWLDRGVVMKQPLTGVSAHAQALPQQPDPARPGRVLPTEVAITDASATLFHGTVGGEARVVLADQARYELWLTAADIQLSELARRFQPGPDADLKGVAQAQLWLYNRPDPRTGQLITEGWGKVDVPTGRMYNLPVLLDLVKVLKLQAPDKTAFEEAHATFRIQGDRIKVDQLDLIGNALCLGGSGEVDTNGEYVRFEFYTIWSKVLKQMINTPVGEISAFLSKNLFKIKLTRKNGELKYEPEAVPALTEPAKAAADRLRARFGRK